MTDEQLAELRRLAEAATSAPWRVATDADVDDNWLVGFGRSVHDNQTYYVTTDHAHASELEGDARTDAAFVAACRTGVPQLLDALAAMTERAEAAEAKLAAMTERAEEAEADRSALDQRLTLALMRAERAEADARVLLTLVRTAAVRHAVEAECGGDKRGVAVTITSYVDALFEAAADNGAFANDYCDPAAVARVAGRVGATPDGTAGVQP